MVIEEHGHTWDGGGDNRCHRCQIKHRQYLEIKVAFEEAEPGEHRREMYRMMNCGGKALPPMPIPQSDTPKYCAVLQLDLWDEGTGRWEMILDCKFNNPVLAHRIKAEVEKMLGEAGEL